MPLLIPVLTSFGLPLGYMGDILGGGLILGGAGFAISIAAIDSGSPYAQLGSSRLRTFGALNEPTVIFVVFVVALTTHTDLPYVLGATLRASTVEVVRPSHLLIVAAFFMLVLNETGRIPVGSHGGTLEFGQIEEGRVAEHSGPGLAFLRWGSSVKQLVLYTIFANVLLVAVGAGEQRAPRRRGARDRAAGGEGARRSALVVIVIESSFAKLRLYKIPEFTVASFMLAVLAVVIFLFQPGFGNLRLTVFGAAATVTAVVVLLLELRCCARRTCGSSLRLYALGSVVVAALAIATAASGHGNGSLYVLGGGDDRAQGAAVPARDPVRAAPPRGRSAGALDDRRAERDPDRDRAGCVRVRRDAPDPHRQRRRRCRCRRCRSRSAACWSRSC